jgi:DNA-binding winged helix-turn-helix (wHTH) protein
VQDQPTLQAIRLVRQSEPLRLTSADYRILKSLADQASEDSRREIWPQIWGEFVQHFDPR